MWLFKLARIALLLGGAFGLAEFSWRVKDRAGPPQFVERGSSGLAGEDTGALPPDPGRSTGGGQGARPTGNRAREGRRARVVGEIAPEVC